MTIYVGGKRIRLIKDNLTFAVEAALDSLGWFDAGRNHRSVQVIGEQLDPSVEITPNIVGVTIEDIDYSELEMGSDLEENRLTTFIDIFAENTAIGQHLTGDVVDFLRGKFTQINPEQILEVYDLSQATPSFLFNCFYEEIEVNNSRSWDLPYNKYWWTIGVDIIDRYMNDTESLPRVQYEINGGDADDTEFIEDVDGGGA